MPSFNLPQTHISLNTRANPFPKVTDLFCRLPLPTLFYQLEALHLEDLLRLSVRPVAKAITSLDFHGPSQVHWQHKNAALPVGRYPSCQLNCFQGPSTVKRKENSSQNLHISKFMTVAVYAPHNWFRNLKRIPFRLWEKWLPRFYWLT